MENESTETCPFIGASVAGISDDYANFRVGQRYRSILQKDGTKLVLATRTLPGSDIILSLAQWTTWFEN